MTEEGEKRPRRGERKKGEVGRRNASGGYERDIELRLKMEKNGEI